MPRLHRANTLACGRLRWGNWLDTVAVHCDTRSEQVIGCLRYLFMMLVSLSITGLASLFLLLVRFLSCQKPTHVCRLGRPGQEVNAYGGCPTIYESVSQSEVAYSRGGACPRPVSCPRPV